MTPTPFDVRLYPSGAVINNSIPNWPTNLGLIAERSDRGGSVWVAHTPNPVGDTAPTHTAAIEALVTAWQQQTAGAA